MNNLVVVGTLGAVVALVVAYATTPPLMRWARRIGWVDRPATYKRGTTSIPVIGGVAMVVATVVGLTVAHGAGHFLWGVPPGADRFIGQVTGPAATLAVAASALAMFGLGVLDDRRPLGAAEKLVAQLGIIAVALLFGPRVDLFPGSALDFVVTALWLVGVTNAQNLLDNMDGAAAGTAAVVGLGIASLAMPGDIGLATTASVLAGACLGFLGHNLSTRRVFMGDAGSLWLGFSLAELALGLRFPGVPKAHSAWFPVLLLAVPIFDTTLVTWSRLRRGVSIATGGRDHLSHRLVLAGCSPRQAVGVLWLVSAVLALLVHSILSIGSTAFLVAALATISAAGVVALVLLERLWARATATDPPGQ